MNGSGTIAIIDDDAAVLRATGSLVRSIGYRVATYGSAVEFLQRPDLERLRCIISDVEMPEMSGVELFRELHRRDLHVPVIFITAFPSDAVLHQISDAAAVMLKPFDGAKLVACLDTVLGAPSPH